MNHDEHRSDSVLTLELRDSLSELALPEPPPLETITSRGRARQRRRLAGFASLGGAGVATGAALALGLTGILGPAPVRTGTAGIAAPARSTGTIRTAAFTLSSNGNGTDTLILKNSQLFDPAALQRALAQHHIPALVKSDIYCTSNPAPPDPMSLGVLSTRPRVNPPHQAVRVRSNAPPSDLNRIAAQIKTVINPAKMPSGTELFFGYSNSGHALFVDLIYTGSYSCRGQLPDSQ
jgi:hypothetical protein